MAGGSSHERSHGAFVVTACSLLCVIASIGSGVEGDQQFNLPPSFPRALPSPDLVLPLFMHVTVRTPVNGTSFLTVPPLPDVPDSNVTMFGAIAVYDNRLTKDPPFDSGEVGRGRGLFIFDNNSGEKVPAVEFPWTAEFNNESGLGGSTLVLKGFDRILDPLRKIAIVGGTGQLALARGYAEIRTFSSIDRTNILNITCYIYF